MLFQGQRTNFFVDFKEMLFLSVTSAKQVAIVIEHSFQTDVVL
jgi:hypothetical protein